MALESIEKLRELACDINGNEIVDHMQLYPSCVFDGAWLNSWHCKFDRELEALEREIADKYLLLPVDADGVPIHVGDQMTDKSEREDGLGIAKWDVASVNEIAFFDMSGGVHMGAGQVHVKPDPVKELLEELVAKVENDVNWRCNASDEIDCMTARIREAVER